VGLPGLGDFIGEFLVLAGAYRASIAITAVATVGIIAATLYGLKISSEVFYGPNRHNWRLPDLFGREWVIVGSMMAALLWLGLYPRSFIGIFHAFPPQPPNNVALLQPTRR